MKRRCDCGFSGGCWKCNPTKFLEEYMGRPPEICVACGEPTGRAGVADDSIYLKSMGRIGILNIDLGNMVGPLCENCSWALKQLGFAKEA